MSTLTWEPLCGFSSLLRFSCWLVVNANDMLADGTVIASCFSQQCICERPNQIPVYIYPGERGGIGVFINVLMDLLTSVVFSLVCLINTIDPLNV